MWKSTLKELIGLGKYGTQAELVSALGARGFDVNQASISRFLRASGVQKRGGVYVVNTAAVGSIPVHSMEVTQGACLAVLKTDPAYAPMLGQIVDYANLDGVLGTVAGDDTVFVALRGPSFAESLRSFLGLDP